jgi:hypothetical protein
MTISNILFEEMIKNSDNLADLELFLYMRDNFHTFYKTYVCFFFERILTPGLEMSITQYNQDNPSHQLVLRKPKTPERYLTKGAESELGISSSTLWPKQLAVVIGSDIIDLQGMYGRVNFQTNDLSDSQIQDLKKVFIEKFPSTGYIWSNNECVCYNYGVAHRNLASSDAIMSIAREVVDLNRGVTARGSFADRYIQDMMEMVTLIDQFFLKMEPVE